MQNSLDRSIAGEVPEYRICRYIHDRMNEQTVIQHMQKKLLQFRGGVLKASYHKIRIKIDNAAVCSGGPGILRFLKGEIPQEFPEKWIFYRELFACQLPDFLIERMFIKGLHMISPGMGVNPG